MSKVKLLFEIPQFQIQNYPLSKMFSQKENGEWTSLSTMEFIKKMNDYSLKLLDLGVKKGDKIALMSSGNIEWNLLD